MIKDPALVSRYEEIRQSRFESPTNVSFWGLAIIKTKGMAAWVRSWRQYGLLEGAPPASSEQPRPGAPRISTNGGELVEVLAAMLWAVQEEGAHHD